MLLPPGPPAVVPILRAVPIPQPVVPGALVSSVFALFALVSLIFERRTRNRHIAVRAALGDFGSSAAEPIRSARDGGVEELCQDCCDVAAAVCEAELPRAGIGCAIRLADNDRNGCVTIARSDRPSKARS